MCSSVTGTDVVDVKTFQFLHISVLREYLCTDLSHGVTYVQGSASVTLHVSRLIQI